MPPRNREPTRAQLSSGLEYVAQKPSFLANFGKPPPSAREPIPTRPDEGEWAAGSGDDDEDEWDKRFGGGDDGPQVVVLKEGRHLSADEVARERRRAKGEPSPTPEEPKPTTSTAPSTAPTKMGPDSKPGSVSTQHKKRKLVGEAVEHVDDKSAGAEGEKDKKKKKKKKANKAMLSFNEAEGEE